MPTPEETIAANLIEPKEATVDGQTFKQHSIPDMIKGAQFLSSKTIGKKKRKGIIFSKYIPGGAND